MLLFVVVELAAVVVPDVALCRMECNRESVGIECLHGGTFTCEHRAHPVTGSA